MDKRQEIHTDITKEQAYQLMIAGYKITHIYYTDNEYLYMKSGVIYDENGYHMGSYYDEFWSKRQDWDTGWSTYN